MRGFSCNNEISRENTIRQNDLLLIKDQVELKTIKLIQVNDFKISLELSNQQASKNNNQKMLEETIHMKKSRSQQPSLLFMNKGFQHLRYYSQNNQAQIKSQSEEEISPKRQEELEFTQKNNNINKKEEKGQIVQIQNNFKESAHFHTESSLDKLKFYEEFLDLFQKQKEASHFAQEKAKEQEMLKKKIIDSRPSKPLSDIKIFLSLIKKPHVDIEQSKPKQYIQYKQKLKKTENQLNILINKRKNKNLRNMYNKNLYK